MDKTPMEFNKFKYYMDRLREEYDWREAVVKLDIDITEHMDTFYYTIDLLSYIFKDNNGIIPEYIFECEWGTKPFVEYPSPTNLTELYDTLIQNSKVNNNV